MNKQEILNMPAGKKMNQLVWWKIFDMIPTPHNNDMSFLPDYSGDMNVAWSIVEKLENGQPEILCNISRISENGQHDGIEWHCHLRCIDGKSTYYYAIADTVPLAICRASLLAVMPR